MGECPVCQGRGSSFLQDRGRIFLRCPDCCLVFQQSNTLPSAGEERARYEAHHNDPVQEGYRKWLESFAGKALDAWDGQGHILDFGSGPRPVLADLLREQGYRVFHYDPFFAPLWPEEGQPFSLILLCEVLEHVARPVETLKALGKQACPKALMAVQTLFLPRGEGNEEAGAFARWWYRQDITHIRFYSPPSLKALAEAGGWKLVKEDKSSFALFEKS